MNHVICDILYLQIQREIAFTTSVCCLYYYYKPTINIFRDEYKMKKEKPLSFFVFVTFIYKF
jgi:hypothetical protein